jgi:hypothetical protein
MGGYCFSAIDEIMHLALGENAAALLRKKRQICRFGP